jgi:hypothetical protein
VAIAVGAIATIHRARDGPISWFLLAQRSKIAISHRQFRKSASSKKEN